MVFFSSKKVKACVPVNLGLCQMRWSRDVEIILLVIGTAHCSMRSSRTEILLVTATTNDRQMNNLPWKKAVVQQQWKLIIKVRVLCASLPVVVPVFVLLLFAVK
jgi:hypothetical protein